MRTLQREMEGAEVRSWQAFLVGQGLLPGNAVDGIFGPKTDEATKAFQARHGLTNDGIVGPRTQAKAREHGFSESTAASTGTTDGLSTASHKFLSSVHPQLAARIRQLASALQQRTPPIRCVVTSGLRTFAEQEALFAQGRTRPGSIVTNARPGQSYHNYGLAVDLASLRTDSDAIDWRDHSPNWPIIGETGQRLGIEWGGVWRSFVDRPHWQLTTGLRLSECLELHRRGGVQAVWNAVSERLSLESVAWGEEAE